MGKKKFVLRATTLVKKYMAMYAEGVLAVGDSYVHCKHSNFFEYFGKNDCDKIRRADKIYPTEYSLTIEGINFFCLTTEPWEEAGEDEKKDN